MFIGNWKPVVVLTLAGSVVCGGCTKNPPPDAAPEPGAAGQPGVAQPSGRVGSFTAGAKPRRRPRGPLYSSRLENQAKAALEAGRTAEATEIAKQMLQQNTDTTVWYYGNVIDLANQILGLAALREGRLDDAKRYLIAAGNTPGSPQLDSFGPSMVLAQELLARGEKETVIAYLDAVAKFWANTSPERLQRLETRKPGLAAQIKQLDQQNREKMELWKSQIRAGQTPKLLMSDRLR